MGSGSHRATRPAVRFTADRLISGRRVRLSTRARTKTEHRQRLQLLDRLLHEGLYDWVHALEAGEASWGDVLYAQRRGELHRPIAALHLRRPIGQLVATLPPASQPKLRNWLAALQLPLTRPLAALATEPWDRHVAQWGWSGAHWNHGRRALSRLLTLLLGKAHPERHALLARVPIYAEVPRLVELPHGSLATVLAHAGPDRPILEALVVTGLRVGELWGKVTVDPTTPALEVHGTKTAAARRRFPVGPRTAALVLFLTLGKADAVRHRWQRVRPVPLHLHDLRHLAAQAAEALGIPEGRRRQWLGHSAPTVHARYTQARWTAEDAERLEAYWVARGLLRE